MREILRAIVFCHRTIDDKDFTETVNCIPDNRMKDLEDELRRRKAVGEIDTVQVGRHRFEASPHTPYEDEVDRFLSKLDTRPHSSMDRTSESESEKDGSIPSGAPRFTGFDDIVDC